MTVKKIPLKENAAIAKYMETERNDRIASLHGAKTPQEYLTTLEE